MRYTSKPSTAAGTLRVSAFGLRQTLVLIVVGVALMWVGVAFAQEAYISHRLSEQVSELRRQNAQIAAENAGYRKDVEALTNGSGDEEEARLNGFARPSEKTFLVTSPSPSPPSRSR
jgi:cell division protein FtsB